MLSKKSRFDLSSMNSQVVLNIDTFFVDLNEKLRKTI